MNARKEPWLHAAVALVVIASAMLLSPPIELMEPNRLLIVALATTANVAVVLPCMYVFIRYPQRGYWTWWAGLSLATIVALAASLVKYQNLRSTRVARAPHDVRRSRDSADRVSAANQ